MQVQWGWKKVPEIVWHQVFKFLDVKAFVQLQSVCRTLNAYARPFSDVYESECLRLYTSDLSLFADL